MTHIFEVKNLVKHFPGITAVDGVNFTIKEGQCCGLLGPNGAGKTTTIEIMEGICKASSGEVLYKGMPLGPDLRQQAGMQFQSTALQDHLTVRDHLNLFRNLYKKQTSLDLLIQQCTLEQFLDKDARKLSGGQRQRLLLAIALINDPEIIFLDEPTTGLDPQSRQNFWGLIRTIKAQRKTIVLSTHYMEEAYQLCDHIMIMDNGKIIADGAPNNLLKKHFSNVVVEIPKTDFKLENKTAPFSIRETEHSVEIDTEDVNKVLQYLLSENTSLQHMKIRARTLEELFLELTGKELRN